MFLVGCSSAIDVDKELSILDLTILDGYEVVDSNTEVAIGDMTYDFTLKLTDYAYGDLVSQIEGHQTFEIIDSLGVHSATFTNWQRQTYSQFASKLGDRYLMETHIPTTGLAEIYLVTLSPNKLHFQYLE